MLLKDKIVVVSGVGPGMGRDISLSCAENGADLVLAARTESKLKEVQAEVEKLGRQALSVPTDVTKPEDRKNLIEKAVEKFGRVDVLVNSAFSQPPFETLEEVSMETWHESMDINCTSALGLSKEAIPQMKKQGSGSIIMITTMSIRNSRPHFGAYAAAKTALFSVARTLANELGPHGIRVNCVAPGYIWGDSVKWYLESQAKDRGVDFEVVQKEITEQIALRRIPDSKEISGSVVFLASHLSGPVTGQTIDVNGGHYLHF